MTSSGPPWPIPRLRTALMAACAALALAAGFWAFSPVQCASWIRAFGYPYIFGLTAAAVWALIRVVRPLGRPRLPWLAVAAATLVALLSDPFRPKVLYDDYAVQATAWQMHATREIRTPARGESVGGTWTATGGYLDKRPYFIPFVISLAHDAAGYRLGNAYAVNAAFTLVLLAATGWLATQAAGRRAAAFAVLLLGTLPLLGLNATGAGLEVGNLAMLSLTVAAAVLYLRDPGEDRLALLVLAALLLSQCRYESVLFAGCAGLVCVLGWIRARRLILPWALVAAPLLLVPYAWHNRVIASSRAQWELHPGQTSRFSLAYLGDNLAGARAFYLGFGRSIPSSWCLTLAGLLGLGWALAHLGRLLRARRMPRDPVFAVLAVFGLGIAANATLLLFYYWGRLDDPMAARFALPPCLLLALGAALAFGRLEGPGRRAEGGRRIGPVLAWAALLLWFGGWGLPGVLRHRSGRAGPLVEELEWERAWLAGRPGPGLFITETSTLPFFLAQIPALKTDLARIEADDIGRQYARGALREIIVAERLVPAGPGGALRPDPEDAPPPGFSLEPLVEGHFGSLVVRLSRAVPPAPGGRPNPPPPAPL